MNYCKRILPVIVFPGILLLSMQLTSFVPSSHPGSMIRGIVQSTAGRPLAGVKVILRNARTNFSSGTLTDNSGEFTFTRIPLDEAYNFTFSTAGYETQTLTGYIIKKAVTLSLIVKMKGLPKST